MGFRSQTAATGRPALNERTLLMTLAAIQFNHPLDFMITHRVHVRGFPLSTLLVFAGTSIISFMAPLMVANMGLLIHRDAVGHLLGYPRAGYVVIAPLG